MNFKEFLVKNNIKIRSWTNRLGVAALFISGLYFVLFIDLYVKFRNETGQQSPTPISIWLFMAIIFAIGGGIFYFFGDANKHKKVLSIVLKAVGLVLSICYIGYLFYFMNWVATSGKIITESLAFAKTTSIISLVIDIVAVLIIIVNFIFSIIFADEDY